MMEFKNKCVSGWVLSALFCFSFSAHAQFLSPQGVTLQGTVFTPGGLPLESASVDFYIDIKSPGAESCLLYSESHTLNMTNSGGAFSLTLGSGTRSGVGFQATSTLAQVFNNSSAAMTSLTCSVGTSYTPGSGDTRKVVLTFDDGSGPQTLTQMLSVQSVPYALNADKAESLQGKQASAFIQVNTTAPADLTQANLEDVFSTTNYPRLQTLLSVPPTNYVQAGVNGSAAVPSVAGNPGSGLAAGQFWYDTTDNVLKYHNGTSVQTLGSAATLNTVLPSQSGNAGKVLTTDGTNVSWGAGGGSPGGISGQIQYNNLGAFAGDANFYWDATNQRLGIGTSSPSQSIQITGTQNQIRMEVPSGSSAANGMYLTENGTTRGGFYMYGSGTPAGSYVDMRYDGSTRLQISTDTTRGDYRFQVPDGGTRRIRFREMSGGYNAAEIVVAKTAGGNNSGTMLLRTTGHSVDQLYLGSSGKVGVGNVTPASQLDVSGEVKVGETGLACSVTTKGAIRYNNTTSVLEFCNGSGWNLIQAAACTDVTPDVFSFANEANATTSTLYSSNIIQLAGINCSVPVTITGAGSPQFRICSDAACAGVVQDWTSSPSSIVNNQYLQARLTTDIVGGATFQATVIVGSGGTVWSVTNAGGDCTVSPAIGTVCADGSIYAGLSPDGNVKMFTTRCDYGQTWDGMNCTGSRLLTSWNNGTSDWTTTNILSFITGQSNSAALFALSDAGAPYLAAQVCETLNENGKSDWYLPAFSELNLLYSNRAAIRNFDAAWYWSSSEESYNYRAWVLRFSDGNQNYSNKNTGYFVRCARR